ncbi:type II toxin-antitoxin system HicA family toxin [Paracoccus angustae]|uniref:Type II toxin-antitoxin system HicA family toxin n=1 Tax=Paracoccus angustae TaxID=1671480 RepID=A0ABV7U6R5_9RHOB
MRTGCSSPSAFQDRRFHAPRAGAADLDTRSRRLLALLKAPEIEDVSQKRSRPTLRRRERTVIRPHPEKDLPFGTIRSIHRQSGLLDRTPSAKDRNPCAISRPSSIRRGTAPLA